MTGATKSSHFMYSVTRGKSTVFLAPLPNSSLLAQFKVDHHETWYTSSREYYASIPNVKRTLERFDLLGYRRPLLARFSPSMVFPASPCPLSSIRTPAICDWGLPKPSRCSPFSASSATSTPASGIRNLGLGRGLGFTTCLVGDN